MGRATRNGKPSNNVQRGVHAVVKDSRNDDLGIVVPKIDEVALASRLAQTGLHKIRRSADAPSIGEFAKRGRQLPAIAVGLFGTPPVGAEDPDLVEIGFRQTGKDQAARDRYLSRARANTSSGESGLTPLASPSSISARSWSTSAWRLRIRSRI
jgi:hypothetical protein